MASKLGQLVIELAANTARLQSDMGKAVGIAERGAAGIKKAFSFVTAGVGGGLIATALIGAAKRAIELGDNLQKAAQKSGIGGKAISELAYAARLADVDIGALSTAIKKMQVNLSEARTGGKAQIETLSALGLEIGNLLALKPDKQFEKLAGAIASLKDPADRARAATEIFGKAGADLLPMFEQGAEGIRKAREEAQRLGLSFSDETLKRLSDTDDEIKRLTASWSAFAVVLTDKVSPALRITLGMLHGEDVRTAAEKLDGQIALLQHRIATFVDPGAGSVGGIIGAGNSGQNLDFQEALRLARQLEELQTRRAFLNGPAGMGGRGRPDRAAPGFVDTAAMEAARKAADKAHDQQVMQAIELARLGDQIGEEALKRDYEAWGERMDLVDDFYRRNRQQELDLAKYREEQAAQTAQTYKDFFLTAYDNMVENGKIKWDELLKYMLAQFARMQFSKMLDSIFDGSNGAGLWSQLLGSLAGGGGGTYSPDGTFFPGRASGGPVYAGQSYTVGERGREVLTMGSNGFITPNHALGGGSTAINLHIDARGATVDAVKLLPSFGKQIIDMAEAKIVQRLKRQHYGPLQPA